MAVTQSKLPSFWRVARQDVGQYLWSPRCNIYTKALNLWVQGFVSKKDRIGKATRTGTRRDRQYAVLSVNLGIMIQLALAAAAISSQLRHRRRIKAGSAASGPDSALFGVLSAPDRSKNLKNNIRLAR